MKKVLLIAYHFPPLAGSSGIQRTLRFAQQLEQFGWQPLVLTAHPRAYERCSDELLDQVPAAVPVRRAFALDAARHLAFRGRYFSAMALPDRWASWRFDAIRQGKAMIREHRPDAIWSTYPIATAHQIGAALARASNLPWIADFRDPMAQDGYPRDPKVWQAYKAIETQALAQAQLCTFTTPSAARTYALRYPQAAQRIRLLENGYDEDTFSLIGPLDPQPLNPGQRTILHSGIVYPGERDPTQLFDALAAMAQRRPGGSPPLRVRFRAAVHEGMLQDLAASRGVTDWVEVLPPLPYREALQEMMRADGLLLLQAASCNEQIPAKLYEYLRAGKPILALTDAAGDTSLVLRNAGVADQAPLDQASDISELFERWLSSDGSLRLRPTVAAVESASRLARSGQLAQWLDEVHHP